MGFRDLSELELLQGFFNTLFIIIALIIGIKILLKYISYKRKEFIILGLTIIFLTSLWWGSSFTFIMLFFFDYQINVFWDLLLGFVFIPITLICWVYSFCILSYPQLKKKMVSIYIAIAIPYDIIFVILLCINTDFIAKKPSIFYTQASPFVLIFQLFTLLTTLITGLLFCKKALRSDDPKIRLKGKFLFIGFITFTICAAIEAAIQLDATSLVLLRIAYICASIEYYFGFFLPNRIKKWLIKER